ncbi:anti-sigma factor family protein [Roseateles chitinivorans]|uniref:anti-sigma factor family protein n=1 Tax=Roseateles chitinivorans TaxID=2917965 RepID=UPI003D6676EE
MTRPTPSAPIVEDDLHAYVDGLLDAERRKAVQDHLDRDPEAAAAVTRLIAQRQLLRSAFAPIVDEPVPERLQLRTLLAQRQAPPARQWRWAAAVLVALGAGSVGGWQVRDQWDPVNGAANGGANGIAALAGEARSSYLAYASDAPEDLDRERLLRVVSDKLRRPVEIPDLSAAGYRFAGGRLVATVHGPAGMFFYDREDGTRMAVMLRPMAVEKEAPMMAQTTRPVGGYSWAMRGLGYSVVGTESPTTLHPVADEVRRQAREKASI